MLQSIPPTVLSLSVLATGDSLLFSTQLISEDPQNDQIHASSTPTTLVTAFKKPVLLSDVDDLLHHLGKGTSRS